MPENGATGGAVSGWPQMQRRCYRKRLEEQIHGAINALAIHP